MRTRAIAVLLAMTCPAIGGGPEPIENPIPERVPGVYAPLALETVVDGMTSPVWGTSAPGLPPWILYVVDQVGILWHVDTFFRWKWPILDVRDRLVPLGFIEERGFLGAAFHPDFAANGRLYTYTSEPAAGLADFSTMPPGVSPDHQTVIAEWRVANPASWALRVQRESRREILRIDQPQNNHNGGTVVFGPDGMLYISLGDGGNEDDQGPGHGTAGNGQNPGTVLGSILRIDPLGANSANGQYGIPDDNPFVDANRGGSADNVDGCADGYCDEIYAYGFRNPYRIAFDPVSGDLYCGDVGQNDIEEINVVVPGNYGWNLQEGTFCFAPNGDNEGYVYACAPGGMATTLIEPIAQYDHSEGIAVVGGFVYQGYRFPWLRDFYLFGDFLSGLGLGRLFTLVDDGRIIHIALQGRPGIGAFLLGFGQDGLGEVYVFSNITTSPIGRSGKVQRLVYAFGP